LFEVVISLIITVAVVTGAMSVFVQVAKLQFQLYQHDVVDAEAQKLTDYLTGDIRGASSVESSVTLDGTTYEASSTTLILKLPSIDADGNSIDPDSVFDYIVYDVTTGKNPVMKRIVSCDDSSARPEQSKIIGKSIFPSITLDGTYQEKPDALGAYEVHYEFTSGRTIGGKSFKEPLAGTVRLRNKL
jgi:hypothetical protein